MVDGWNAVHGGEPKPEPMADDEFEAMVEASAASEAERLNHGGR